MMPSPAAPSATVPGPKHRWLSAMAVLACVLVVGLSGPVAAAIVSKPGRPVVAAPGVRITPAPGWEPSGRLRGAYEGLRLSRGSATLDVLAPTFQPSADPVAEYITLVLDRRLAQLQVGSAASGRLPNGLGVRLYYVGLLPGVGQVEGELTFLAAPVAGGERLVIFDARAPRGQLGFVLSDVHAMIEAAQVR
jgi:hypothetical protein